MNDKPVWTKQEFVALLESLYGSNARNDIRFSKMENGGFMFQGIIKPEEPKDAGQG